MKLNFERLGRSYVGDLLQSTSLYQSVAFDGETAGAFSVSPARAERIVGDHFVGDVGRGGSCNVTEVSFIPHCHGTHLETVNHILVDAVSISFSELMLPQFALLLCVDPEMGGNESYNESRKPSDFQITSRQLELAYERAGSPKGMEVLMVCSQRSSGAKALDYRLEAPYFSFEAMEWINVLGVQHLVCDLPSVDRMIDGGQLRNHRLFWNLGLQQVKSSRDVWANRVIVELANFSENLAEGPYGLFLNPLPWNLDAVPAQPLVFPLQLETKG